MKLNSTMLALSLGLCAFAAGAQTIDMGPDTSGYRRFLLYPHLERGLAAMARGERRRALVEFEQARLLAPDNPAVTLHLAGAYRHFGNAAYAETVLREQLARHPGHAALTRALEDLRARAPAPQEGSGSPSSAKPAAAAPAAARTPVLARMPASAAAGVRSPAGLVRVAQQSLRAGAAPAARRRPSKAASAHALADQAYKASAQGDHEAAVLAARQAVRLAPANRDYRLLLAYELAEIGQFEESDAVVFRTPPDKSAAGLDDELAARHRRVRQRIALKYFEAAQEAATAGQADVALESARRAIRYAPDQLAHRLQLLSLLLGAQQWEQADQSASDAMEAIGMQPALLVLRAHARQRSGQREAASADLDAALAAPGLTASERLQFGLIATDAALAGGEAQKALDLLAPLLAASAADEGVRQRQALALQAWRSDATLPAVNTSWPSPKVICVGNALIPLCELWPGETPSPPGHAAAEAAYQAFAGRDYPGAARQAREALALSPDHLPYRALLVNALMADGQLEQAEQEASAFLATSADDGEMLALRSSVRQRMGQEPLAALDAEAALRSGNLSAASEIAMLGQLGRTQQARERFAAARREGALGSQSDVDVAYLAIRVGDDAAAMQAFDEAASARPVPALALLDAGYAAGRLGRNERAVAYFRQAIDVSEADRASIAPQSLFEARRTVAERSRTSGFNAALTYRGIASGALSLTPGAATDDIAQGGLEAYWRPWGYGDGRRAELYGTLSGTLYSKAGLVTGAPTAQAALGARVKPLINANLVLALERRLGIGSQAQSDWLARLGYSWDKGLDLRVDTPAWWSAQVYAEAGRFIKLKQTYALFEAQAGRSFRLDAFHPRLVVLPHLVFGAERNTAYLAGKENAVGAGVGASLRYWFNEDRYSAARSYADVSLQYRSRISGDERARGVFLRLVLAY